MKNRYLHISGGGRGVKCAVSAFALFAAIPILAETYRWNCTDGEYHSFGEAANWLVSGSVPDAAPSSASDIIQCANGANSTYYFDLGDAVWTLGNLAVSGSNPRQYGFRNGSLTFSSGTSDFSRRGSITVADALLKFDSASTFTMGGNEDYDGAPTYVYVKSGGTLDLEGKTNFRKSSFSIEEGGKFVWGSTAKAVNANINRDWIVENSGTLDWSYGFKSYSDAWSFRPLIYQNGGEWILGNKIDTVNNIYWRIELKGGKIAATGDVTFSLWNWNGSTSYKANSYARIMPDADIEINVAEGKTLDMATDDDSTRQVAFTYAADDNGANHAKITRTGAGTLILPDMPYSWIVAADAGTTTFSANTRTAMGTLKVAAGQSFTFANENTTLATLAGNAGTITFAAPGISIGALADGAALSGTFAIDGTAFSVGDTIATTSDATLRAKIKSDLEAVGVNVVENGDTLSVGASELIFNSTASGDLNADANWRNGAVPPAGASVTISGEGVTADMSAAIPAWSSITVSGGATLRVSLAGAALPQILLSGDAALEIAADAAMANGFSATPDDGGTLPRLTVAQGAALSVPGGTAFGGVAMSVAGALAATGTGDLTLGWAPAGETLPFALSVDGGTISAAVGDINFVCPASGGTVTAAAPLSIANATLTTANQYAFNFGVNNPENVQIEIVFDDTTLTYPTSGYASVTKYFSGGVRATFKNGSCIHRGSAEAKGQIAVNGAAQLVFKQGTSFKFGLSQNSSGSSGNGTVSFNPTADGFNSLVVDGATLDIYRWDGNGKAVVKVQGASTYETGLSWWNSKYQPFLGIKAVDFDDGASLTMTWPSTYAEWSSQTGRREREVSIPFTGGGSLLIDNDATSKAMTMTVSSSASTATGSLSASAGKNLTFKFADGAKWAGPVTVNDATVFVAADGAASSWSVGGLVLQRSFTLRIWEASRDTLNIGEYGITGAAEHPFTLSLQDGYEPVAGTEIPLGVVPASFDVSTFVCNGDKWTFKLSDIDGDDARKTLTAVVADVDYTFTGGAGETKVVDLSDASGWASGSVPTGQDVAIDGVTAVVSGSSIPSFASIVLKNGAGLRIVGDAGDGEYAGVTLPPVELRTGTTLSVADGGIATASGAVTAYVADGEALPEINVASGATLNVPGGTAFKNVALVLNGTLATTGDGTLSFGYAASGESTRFAFHATNATIAVRNEAATAGASRIDFLSPASGGTVEAVGDIELVDCTVSNGTLDGFAFGRNNGTETPFKVVCDATTLNWGAASYIAGATTLVMTNNAVFHHVRNNRDSKTTAANLYPLVISELGKMTLVDGGELRAPICFHQDTYQGAIILNPSEAGHAGIEVLEGGVANWHKLNGRNTASGNSWTPRGTVAFAGGEMRVSKGWWWSWTNCPDDFLYGLAGVPVAQGTTLTLRGSDDPYVDSGDPNLLFTLVSPFTGAGDVVVTNVRNIVMRPVVANGENECTGTIRAADCAEGAGAQLLFQSGSNWAGTVVANGKMELVDAVAGTTPTHDSPASVSFGKLDLQSDFPVRVWKDADGAVTGCDALNVGEYLNNGGRLVPTLMGSDDADGFGPADEITVGKMGKNSPLPAVGGKWVAKTAAIDGDDANVALILSKSRGFQVIIR